ncbi:formylmethanofuran dehydrogenase subunit C [Variovorax rhizosphaerae]|uniref:Formylmethanofuran dehydrogenase subunit C n=1 Tax=Variovorax rhizosphaerae TaxID=1836200 RepID=A0ABU8WSV9_9BURK
MSGWRLALKSQPTLRVDLRGVVPDALAGMSAPEVERIPVGHGNAFVALAEFFSVTPHDKDESLRFDGDLSRFDRVGWKMASGSLRVMGPVGHYAGGCMSAGEMLVEGDAGLLAACEMAGGRLTVQGDVGDFAASTLPGSMDGMRGGTFVVRGNAGARFGDRMRRGSAVVHGRAGDFLASRMVAGTIAVGGSVGNHVGHGMRRGSVVLSSSDSFEPAATFVPAIASADVIWQLLARDLARHGGPFAALASRRIERHLGDLCADGKGELIAAK